MQKPQAFLMQRNFEIVFKTVDTSAIKEPVENFAVVVIVCYFK